MDPLIRTKLRLPFTRPGLVLRPRLVDQVAQGLRGPLTLITAPAGFGKTTLAASAVAGCGMTVAWLSLDKYDSQTGRFLRYLIAALQEADPTIAHEAAQLAAAVQPARPEAILTSLINDLDAAGRDIILVLDDYQFMSSQSVHDGMAFLLEHCPKTFHLVIASRSDPPLPLARLRARGQTVELRAADLRFTGREAAQFLNEVMGLDLDDGSVTTLEERTEGWIAGLQMAALSMRDRKDVLGFIEGFSGTNRYILDYLLEEVLASQPAEIQRFLLGTSILERLSAPLCDAVIGDWEIGRLVTGDRSTNLPIYQDSSKGALEYLERLNLFLMPLDDERRWYRYHHLFADLLRARLQQAQPEWVPRLHIRASGWLEQNGYLTGAIYHLCLAQEFERAADLIERYGPVRMAEGDPAVLHMAGSLPQEVILARPKIGLYQAWLLIIQGRIDQARPLLHDLARQLAGVSPDSEPSWLQTVVAAALAFLAPPASVAGRAAGIYPLPEAQRLDAIPAGELILRNTADYLYGMALARRGELERAVEFSAKSIQREKLQLGTQTIPTLAPFLSRLYLMMGHLQAAASLCREFLDPIQEKGIRFVYSSGSMQIDLGEVLCEWNLLDEAEQRIRDGLQSNAPWRNIMTDGFGLIALARVLRAKGDFSGALQVAERFETRLMEHSRPREFDEDFHTLRIRLQLASGDVQAASRWADQFQPSEEFKSHPECYRLTLALIRLVQGRFAEVEKLLAGATAMPLAMTAGSRIARELECSLLLAAAAAGQQRLPEAIEFIASSLALGEPGGYVRVFLDAGEAARELLAAYLRSTAPEHKNYARRILNSFSHTVQPSSPVPQPAGLIEPLTGREVEVLQLIALGRTNQEIARQLIVSPGTVKAHTASIYRKLDVANRTEACARARQLGLLP